MASSSQQDIRPRFGMHSASLDPDYTGPNTVGRMTEEERDAKIEQFEKYILDIQRQILEFGKKNKTDLRIYYFIGRLNPPHKGHIDALEQLIQRAIDENPGNSNYKIIILLGSGPKKGNRLDNPISFLTKKNFIESKLQEKFPDTDTFIFNTNVDILDMTNAPSQIIAKTLPLITENIEKIAMLRASGMKDGDVSKLKFIEENIRKILIKYESILTTNVIGIEPVTNADDISMSATQVRIDILQDCISQTNLSEKWRSFYGSFFDTIKGEICRIAEIVNADNVRSYIAEKHQDHAGGSRIKTKRRRNRKTKRRKTKRRTNKRRTKRTNKRRRN